MQTIWITKYALTSGLEEVELVSIKGVWAHARWPQGLNGEVSLARSEWEATKEEALARAEKMRKDRLASLRKQIAKLETQPIKLTCLGSRT